MSSIKKRSNCPISCSLDIWGDKWSLLIVRDLIQLKQATYGDLLKGEEKIATNILATRLQMLEEQGIILKAKHPDSKAKVLYTLTQKGIDLLPLLIEIHLWTEKYGTIPENKKALVKEAKKDREAFINRIIQDLQESIVN